VDHNTLKGISQQDIYELAGTSGLPRVLERLDLSHNFLSSIPHEISLFPLLRTLDLQHNCLEELPSSLSLLSALTHLDVSNNRLRTLPPELGSMEQLDQFNVDCNPLDRNLLRASREGHQSLLLYLRSKIRKRVPSDFDLGSLSKNLLGGHPKLKQVLRDSVGRDSFLRFLHRERVSTRVIECWDAIERYRELPADDLVDAADALYRAFFVHDNKSMRDVWRTRQLIGSRGDGPSVDYLVDFPAKVKSDILAVLANLQIASESSSPQAGALCAPSSSAPSTPATSSSPPSATVGTSTSLVSTSPTTSSSSVCPSPAGKQQQSSVAQMRKIFDTAQHKITERLSKEQYPGFLRYQKDKKQYKRDKQREAAAEKKRRK
jgi:Regulator of G protein signaling domain/Leucine Rich Repeat